MAISSYPFDGLDTTETEFSILFRELQETGVIGTPGDNSLKVTADGSGLNVKVSAGVAIVRGHVFRSTAIEVIETIASGTLQPRIDTVVLRLDPSANRITLEILEGQPSNSPAPPAREQTDTGVYELALGNILVGINAVTILGSDVSDKRRYTSGRINVWTNDQRPVNPRKFTLGMNADTLTWEWFDGVTYRELVTWATLGGKPTTSTLDGRTLFVSDIAPTSADGQNGDVWFEF